MAGLTVRFIHGTTKGFLDRHVNSSQVLSPSIPSDKAYSHLLRRCTQERHILRISDLLKCCSARLVVRTEKQILSCLTIHTLHATDYDQC